jgi:rSAM/selenodomain-associated transferase 2
VTLRLSVIIPAWREAERIAATVRAAREIGDEVIVADAGSDDGTAEEAARAGAVVVQAAKGRGAQLHAGALAARGEVLLFLHADASLPPAARERIHAALADPDVLGGNFYLRFEPDGFFARLFTWLNDARRRLLRIYYGDSAIFVRRAVYEALGGFRAYPLFEDYDFVRRLERAGRTAYLREVTVTASARRFVRRPFATLAVWVLLQAAFSAGVSPFRLARFYAHVRG